MTFVPLKTRAIASLALTMGFGLTTIANAGTREDLQSLYPDFTSAQVEQKIQASSDSFMFMRSFIPYFYFLIKQDASVANANAGLKPVTGDTGWCAGDAHPENFGAMIDANGLAVFSINDVDDSGPCPLYADALRFFTATIVNDPRTDLRPLVAAYNQGLSGASTAVTSTAVIGVLAASKEGGQTPDPKEISNIEELKKSHNMAAPVALNANEASQIGQALSAAYADDVSVVSGIKTQKLDGGSFGLTRYRVVISISSFTDPQVVELKQEVQPGIFPMATSAIPATADRIQRTLQLEQGTPSGFYTVTNIAGVGDLLVRPLIQGNVGISLEDYNSNDLASLLADEARTLGALHRKTASAHYISSVQTIDSSAWTNAAQQLSKAIAKTYQTVKK